MITRVLLGLLLLAAAGAAHAQGFPFRRGGAIPPQMLWMPAASADSYIIYCGTSTGTYTQSDDVGNVTYVVLSSTTLTLVRGTQYYCAVRTVLASVESANSNEICFIWNGPNRRTTSC